MKAKTAEKAEPLTMTSMLAQRPPSVARSYSFAEDSQLAGMTTGVNFANAIAGSSNYSGDTLRSLLNN